MARHKLREYQKETVYEIEQTYNGRSLVSLEAGLGKTATSLWYLHRNRATALPAVVVCPASIKYVWEHEALQNLGLRAAVLDGQRPPRSGHFTDRPDLVIINYDILRFWVDWLREMDLRTIIIDESQYISNRRALRTQATRDLCRGVPNVLALSGTPLTNRPAELWPTLNILRPDLFKSFWAYAHQFCEARRTPWGWNYGGARDIPTLHRLLRRAAMVRYLKKDVLHELPDKQQALVPVPMTNPGEYRKAKEDFLAWLTRKDPGKARAAARAQRLTQLGYLRRLAAQLKIDAVVEWIKNFLAGGDDKLVVFAVHKGMIAALRDRVGAKSVTVDGGVTGLNRKAAVQAFQGDKSVRVFYGNVQAAGVGLTLTAASTVAFAELPWTPGALSQAADRIHRIGQQNVSWIYYLVAAGSIEEHLCKILQEKQEVIRGVLDGVDGGETLDIYDQLCARLLAP